MICATKGANGLWEISLHFLKKIIEHYFFLPERDICHILDSAVLYIYEYIV